MIIAQSRGSYINDNVLIGWFDDIGISSIAGLKYRDIRARSDGTLILNGAFPRRKLCNFLGNFFHKGFINPKSRTVERLFVRQLKYSTVFTASLWLILLALRFSNNFVVFSLSTAIYGYFN